CEPDQTCVKGTCVAATTTCSGACDEATLLQSVNGTPPTQGTDASLEGGGVGTLGGGYNDITQAVHWSTFDAATVRAGIKGFIGAAFDRRYVYFVPGFDNTGAVGTVLRYDTQGAFDAGTSWSTFDVPSLDARARGFEGAVFDGRYLYLVPYA